MLKVETRMKKKIIFVHLALWMGGIEIALVNMLNRMDYEKYDVTCLIVTAYDDNLIYRITSKCKLYRIDRTQTITFKEKYPFYWMYKLSEKPSVTTSKLKMLRWRMLAGVRHLENILYIKYVKKLMSGQSYDTAIIFSGKVAELTVKSIRAKKYVSFYHYGDMRHEYHDKTGYSKSSAIVAVSNNLADSLKKFMPEYKDKIVAVHNLVDVTYIREKSKEEIKENFEKHYFNIVTCGRLAEEKGMDLAVYACYELVKSGNTQIRWWIIGEGPEHENLLKLIHEKQLEEYIKVLGQRENPYSYMAQGDIYVQPSRREAFGLTILEAMIVGCPVISTYTAGGTELIEHGINGRLCSISAEDIANEVLLMLNNRTLLDNIKNVLMNINFEKRNNEAMNKIEMLI